MKQKIAKYLREGFFKGIGWSFGATFGFLIISGVFYILVSALGGLPLVGSWIADLVEATQNSLYR